ncbi:hypothetical protein ACFLYO_03450 [Chloroflexota bacterium]
MAHYYPDQTTVLPMTLIRRDRLLPPDVFGTVEVQEGERVVATDIVARGVRASQYVVVDLAAHFRTDDAETLHELIQVEVGDVVETGDILAEKEGRRGHVVRATASGLVAQNFEGRLVLHTGLSEVVLRADMRGTVAVVHGRRGVVLETVGGLVQGAWGNGDSQLGTLQAEPDGGLGALEVDEFAPEWRGALVVVPHCLDRRALAKANTQKLGGIIAASMPVDLRKIAMRLKMPIMLTEGFGDERMNRQALHTLESYYGRQASLNAVQPDRWSPDRPEVIIPDQAERDVSPPARAEHLRVDAEVRLVREPFPGVIATIKDLPAAPQRLENGLRVPVAAVTLPSGRTVTVPLVNLELFGRG